MLTVHHLNNSRSQRILWLLEELGVSYEIERYERDPETLSAPPSLKKLHPLGRSPVVVDDDHVLAESGAIVEYLVERYDDADALRPTDETKRLQYRYWLHYAEGSAMPPLFLALVFSQLPKRAPWLVRPLLRGVQATFMKEYGQPVIDLHMNYWEDTLREHGWFVGEAFSAADVQMSFPVEAALGRFGAEGRFEHLSEWLARVQARPAYQRALERGGPYSLEF